MQDSLPPVDLRLGRSRLSLAGCYSKFQCTTSFLFDQAYPGALRTARDTCADDCHSVCVDDQDNVVGIPLCHLNPGGGLAMMTCQPENPTTCRCAPAVVSGMCVVETCDTYCGDGICRFIETGNNCPEDCPE